MFCVELQPFSGESVGGGGGAPCLSCSRNDKNEMVQPGLLPFLQELVDLNLFSPALLKSPSLINTKPLKAIIQCLKYNFVLLAFLYRKEQVCILFLYTI